MRAEGRAAASLLALVLLSSRAAPAFAQACCAGSGAVTPARLGLHDDAVVGAQLRAANVFGSHDSAGRYVSAPSDAREIDLEEAAYAAVRVLRNGQLGALVPFVQTHRAASGRSETGGGVGDVNLSARYDFLRAHESLVVPGIGLLAGVTLPTGTSVESADKPFATDATGLGAVQANGGLALEQAFGPWLVGLSGLVAIRAPRTVGDVTMELAPQYTLLASVAYAFDSGTSVALAALCALEGDATVRGATIPNSSRRWTQASASIAYPVTDQLFVVGSLFFNPPVSSLGVNQPTTAGMTLGVRWAFL